jgi:hypothetical protein
MRGTHPRHGSAGSVDRVRILRTRTTPEGPGARREGGRLRESALPGLVFLAVTTIAVFWRHLFAGYSFPHDYRATVRWPVFLTSTVGGGHFTEWIPFVGGGMALPYNAASGLYFPVWWVMGALHVPATVTMVNLVVAAHIFLGSAGTFVLARSLGVERRWALVAGTAFLFFGGLYSNGYLDMIVRGHTYAPWLLWTLTPPRDPARGWLRVIGLPFWVWVLASGGYPGQAMAFLQVSAVYLAAQLWLTRQRLREFLPYLLAAVVGSFAVFVAVYLPSLLAARAGELYRPFAPTAYWRAIFALDTSDLFGLYLDPFAWNDIPSIITGWAVGVVVLIGLTGLGLQDLRLNLPLVLAGVFAFLLAFLPSWLPAGRVMASIPLLFPSRLPASDSKAIVAVALVCLGAVGWSRIAVSKSRPTPLAALALGVLLIAGMALAPQYTEVPAARYPWLVGLLVVSAVCLVFLRSRLTSRVLFAAVMLLTVAEGTRVVFEMQLIPGQSPWALPPAEFPERDLQNSQARLLRQQLDHPPERRPARIPEQDLVQTRNAHGHVNDALGYLGANYNLGDYASAITTARRNIILEPKLRAVMLEPWTAWVWPCREMDCSGKEIDIPEFAGKESDRVQTSSYGLSRISYRVALPERSLMIENETFARGWDADRPDIKPVSVDGTLRGWVLPAGNYEFTASFVLPERRMQLGLVSVALAALAIAVLLYMRARSRTRLLPALPEGGRQPGRRA